MVFLAAAIAGPALLMSAPAMAAGPTTVLVSVSVTGGAGNAASSVVAVTPDGRFVVFNSQASNLVAGDTNSVQDVFVRNIQTGHTVRVSVGLHRRQANAACEGTAISADGRFVVFESDASNLLHRADTNHALDVFVRDRHTGTTRRVSVSAGGGPLASGGELGVISGDGRYVAFTHFVDDFTWHTYVRDLLLHTTRVIDRQFNSQPAAISQDGRVVALYVEDDNGAPFFIYLRDRVASSQVQVPSPDFTQFDAVMTPDANYLAFSGLNDSGQGLDTFRWHRGDASVTVVSVDPVFLALAMGISADGRYVAFESGNPSLVPGDTNGTRDVFRFDATGPTTIRTSLSATGAQLAHGGFGSVGPESGVPQGNLITADGTLVAFDTTSRAALSDTNTHADVYVRGPL